MLPNPRLKSRGPQAGANALKEKPFLAIAFSIGQAAQTHAHRPRLHPLYIPVGFPHKGSCSCRFFARPRPCVLVGAAAISLLPAVSMPWHRAYRRTLPEQHDLRVSVTGAASTHRDRAIRQIMPKSRTHAFIGGWSHSPGYIRPHALHDAARHTVGLYGEIAEDCALSGHGKERSGPGISIDVHQAHRAAREMKAAPEAQSGDDAWHLPNPSRTSCLRRVPICVKGETQSNVGYAIFSNVTEAVKSSPSSTLC